MSLLLALLLAAPCTLFQPPVDGPIVEPFAPIGRYAGHWGIDFAVPIGSPVGAAAGGTVSFAGVVVGNRTVTVDHGGVKTSYSHLASVGVRRGQRVGTGELVGRSGLHGGRPALHFSVRAGGVYIDPGPLLTCRHKPGLAVWLLPAASPAYPSFDAGHLGRNLRPTPRSAPGRR